MFNNKYRHLIVSLLIGVISLIIEIFICNANAFRIKNNGLYEPRTYTLENLVIEGADVDTEGGVITYRKDYGGSVFITFNDIETNIGTVYMDLEIPNGVLKYVVAYTDETNESFYRSFEREYVAGIYKTKWFTCHLRGESRQLIIRIDNLEDGYAFRLNHILINEPVPIDISFVRLIVIFTMISLLYGLRCMVFFQKQEKIWAHDVLLCMIPVGFIILAVLFYTHSFSEAKLNLMYNTELVDALIKGQLHLDIEVSEALKALDNPYDTSVRQTQGVEYSWDTAYYNGKYYCYYGVVPVLLFFVPYKLITGAYLQCNIVVIIAYCLYILLLDLVCIKIFRHCMPKAPFGIEFIGLILLNSATSIFFYAAEPTFYLVPYAVGLLFVALGFAFFTFWYTGKRSNTFLLFMGAVCLALAVGCRPPMIFYTMLIIPFGIMVIKEKRKACIRDMVMLMIPYVVIGSALALYNYLRFDSIIEFGQTYQLTAQDQLHNTHTLYEVPVLLWLGLFQPLNFSAVFPFVSSGNPIHNYAGNFYIGNAIIPLFSGLPILYIMFSPTMWKKWKTNTGGFSGRMLPFTVALSIIMMISVFVNAGVECRYSSEFGPIMCIAAILLFSNYIQKAQTETVIASMTLLLVLVIYSFSVSFFSGISGEHGYMLTYHPEFYYSIERLFCFWK